MVDEWLSKRLRVANEPVDPDPAFAEALYSTLAAELELAVPDGSVPTAPLGASGRMHRGWPGLLLVAILVVATISAVAVVAGGFIRRGEFDSAAVVAPPICQLISEGELAAIVGFPVTRIAPAPAVAPTTSCVYVYDTARRPGLTSANLLLSIVRYATADAARTEMGPGIRDYRSIPGLADAAALYDAPPWLTMYVLHGRDIISIGSTTGGVFNAASPAQMEAVARRILARLP